MHRGAGRGNKLRGRPRRRGEYQGQRRAESHKEPRGSWRKRERGGALDLPKKRKYNAEIGAATAVIDICINNGIMGAQEGEHPCRDRKVVPTCWKTAVGEHWHCSIQACLLTRWDDA